MNSKHSRTRRDHLNSVSDTCDVVIVGAGPVGATAALLLADQGIDCTVIELRNKPRSHPAAHVLSTRSLEIWREVGLEPEIRRLSAPAHELRSIAYCTSLAGPEMGRVPLIDDLTEDQLDEIESISPTRTAHLPQNALEPLLWERLHNHDRIKVLTGWQYRSHTDGGCAVAIWIAHNTSQASRTIVARYLIAADGASSTVRRALRIPMEGPVLQHMISVHFSADLEDFRRNRRGPVMWTHTAMGLGTFIVHRSPDDLVFQIPYFPPVESPDDFTRSICRRHILDAVGDPTLNIDIKSIQSWAMHAQVAGSYRVGRAFLVGDAAHRFPPTGGLGLNTGTADVHNLAWKLAWVINGRAHENLLDTYEQERRPVGIAATANSVANFEGLLEVVAALGLPRQAVRLLPQLVASLPSWVPHGAARRVVRGVTALGYQRFRLAKARGWVGRRIRSRVAAVLTSQGPHYRSWGHDLGVRYQGGAVIADRLPAPQDDPQFYTPCVRAGGRLPHSWVQVRDRRMSTLDLISRDQLTLLISDKARGAWLRAATGLPFSVVLLDEHEQHVLHTGVAGAEPDAVIVRPDGHIAAVLPSDQQGAALLREALAVVGMLSPAAKGSTA